MITDREKEVYAKLINQAQGTKDNLLSQIAEKQSDIARLEEAVIRVQEELDVITSKLQPEVDEFETAKAIEAAEMEALK
jgi:molecular chaperone GrpE (heat shock protein)